MPAPAAVAAGGNAAGDGAMVAKVEEAQTGNG